jgi:DNA-directed RNA polymerase subunit RPC12/RpoP
MAENKCPSCGATMRIATSGGQHDRVLHCDYCSHQIDLVDEVTTHESEETGPYRDADGNLIQSKRVTITTERYGPPTLDSTMGQIDMSTIHLPPQADIRAQMDAVRNVVGAQMGAQMAEQITEQMARAMAMHDDVQKQMRETHEQSVQRTLASSQSAMNMGRIFLVIAGFAVLCGIGAFLVLVLAVA